mgnify:FL=1
MATPFPDSDRTASASAEAAALLEELCAISSASGDVDGLERMVARLARELEPYGFACEVERETGGDGSDQPVLVARRPAGRGRPTLLIGHVDTVLPAAKPRRSDDRLVATGALDMKGGFAALLGALRLMTVSRCRIADGLLLLAVPDEEIGGPISERVVRRWGAEAGRVLVLEPGELRGEDETLVTGRRGMSVWRLEARGTASHSGLAYWQGRSAVAAAAHWCASAQGLSEPASGPIVNVGRIVGGDAEFVEGLGEQHGLLGTPRRLNIVADRCLAEGEVRFLSSPDRDRCVRDLRELADAAASEAGVEVRFEVVEDIPPVDPYGPGRRLAETLVETAARHGWTLHLEDDRGGVSFTNFLPDPSAMEVVDGLGPVGGGMHTRDEFLDLRSLRRRIALLATLLAE